MLSRDEFFKLPETEPEHRIRQQPKCICGRLIPFIKLNTLIKCGCGRIYKAHKHFYQGMGSAKGFTAYY